MFFFKAWVGNLLIFDGLCFSPPFLRLYWLQFDFMHWRWHWLAILNQLIPYAGIKMLHRILRWLTIILQRCVYRVFLQKGNRSSKVSYFSNTHIHIINHYCHASLSYALLKVTGTKPTFSKFLENQKLEKSMPRRFHLLDELLKVLRMSGFCPRLFKYQSLRHIHRSSRPNP